MPRVLKYVDDLGVIPRGTPSSVVASVVRFRSLSGWTKLRTTRLTDGWPRRRGRSASGSSSRTPRPCGRSPRCRRRRCSATPRRSGRASAVRAGPPPPRARLGGDGRRAAWRPAAATSAARREGTNRTPGSAMLHPARARPCGGRRSARSDDATSGATPCQRRRRRGPPSDDRWCRPRCQRAGRRLAGATIPAMLDHEEKFLFKEEILHLANAVAEPASSTTSRTC